MTFTTVFGGTAFGEEGETSDLVFSATIEQIILLPEYQFNAIIETRVYTDAQFSH